MVFVKAAGEDLLQQPSKRALALALAAQEPAVHRNSVASPAAVEAFRELCFTAAQKLTAQLLTDHAVLWTPARWEKVEQERTHGVKFVLVFVSCGK